MNKKLIAPTIITVLLVLYFMGYALMIAAIDDISLIVKLFGFLIPALLTGVSVSVLVERIKEVRSGEEDDLSKY
ncbi:MAG: hypothetical protein Q4F83_14780 [Eubacteriales bacterium]|nr:hypothetical protein [Eubacteriales bacterium]